MSKKTLLEIVQDILSDMVSDEVNSIDDTVESQTVAQIVRSTYDNMMANRNWPHTKKIESLDSLVDIDRPVYLRLPENIKEIVEIRYDCSKVGATSNDYRKIKYLTPEEFLAVVMNRRSDSPEVQVVEDSAGVKFNVFKNRAPEYYTSFDDTNVVFDSYDSAVDTTLTSSKSLCIAYFIPTWVHSDTAIPDLPVEAFPALIAEAKAASFYNLKQMVNERSEIQARRQNTWLARKAWRVAGGVEYPNYGRKGRR